MPFFDKELSDRFRVLSEGARIGIGGIWGLSSFVQSGRKGQGWQDQDQGCLQEAGRLDQGLFKRSPYCGLRYLGSAHFRFENVKTDKAGLGVKLGLVCLVNLKASSGIVRYQGFGALDACFALSSV